MTRRRATTALTIPIRPDIASAATLSPVPDVAELVYLVTVDEEAAAYWGIARRAGTVIGGISRVRRGWGAVAYTDRDHLLHSSGPAWFLPDQPSRARAVRALAAWWWLVDTGRTEGCQPTDLTPAYWRQLIR
jgi:hypothetical protein